MASDLLAGRYRLKQQLGVGGMCEVLLVEDVRLSSLWALKRQLPPDKRTSTESLEREASLMSSLSHACIPTVADFFVIDDIEHLVMELCPGENLATILEHSPLPAELALEMGIKLADTAHYLHTQKVPIIFRDIKPANIMVSESGSVRLIDFGIARLHKEAKATDTQALGTPGYAAPEQYGRGQSDERTDIFGLGATIHHALTGVDPTKNPFTFPPVSRYCPDLPLAVERLLDKAVALKPEDRFQSMDLFLKELEAVRTHRDMKLALESSAENSGAVDSLTSQDMKLRVQLEEQELVIADLTKERESLKVEVELLRTELTKEKEQARKAVARASVEDKQVQLELQKLQGLLEKKERERKLEMEERVTLEKSLSETNARSRQTELDLLRYEEAFKKASVQAKHAVEERDRLISELQEKCLALTEAYEEAIVRKVAASKSLASLMESKPDNKDAYEKLAETESELASLKQKFSNLKLKHKSTLAQLEARRLEIVAIADAAKRGNLKDLEHLIADQDTSSLAKISKSGRLHDMELLLRRSCELWMRAERRFDCGKPC